MVIVCLNISVCVSSALIAQHGQTYRGIQPETSSGQNDSQSNVPEWCRPSEVDDDAVCYYWDVPQQEAHQEHTYSPETVWEERSSFPSWNTGCSSVLYWLLYSYRARVKPTCCFLNFYCSHWIPETERLSVDCGHCYNTNRSCFKNIHCKANLKPHDSANRVWRTMK